jgi:signal transduction histidine kinase
VGAWQNRFSPLKLETELESWLLRQLTRPAASTPLRTAGIAGAVLLIGAVDFLTGVTLSLQVFYLAPIILALIWLGIYAAFWTSLASVALRVGGDIWLHAEYTRSPSLFWNTFGFLITYTVIVVILHSFIRLRQQMEERVEARTAALAEATRARAQLQQELIEVSERERRAIGNDLHDGLGQHLTAMAFAARVLSQQLGDREEPAAKTAREIVNLAEEGILQSRQLARGLLLTSIDPGRLNQELEELASTNSRQSGVKCTFQSDGDPLVSDSVTASNLFRIAEEATRNALRHSGAHHLHIRLRQDDAALTLEIQDDGQGLPPDTSHKIGVGLRVMSHRARFLGGELFLRSAPAQGTLVTCRVPLEIESTPLA